MFFRARLTRGWLFWTILVVAGMGFVWSGWDGWSQAWAAPQEAVQTSEAAGPQEAAGDHPPEAAEAHGESLSQILAALFIILLAAKAGGELMERIQQPAVLGELLFGLLIGNLNLVGIHQLEFLKDYEAVNILAEIGVILLLFQVGLESNLKEMLTVGLSSFLAAVIGVVTPFLLGTAVSWYFFPYEPIYLHIYAGAVLCATSVGITARVLADMGKLQTKEAKIVLGAAVIDDVLGLIVLAVVIGVIKSANAAATGGPATNPAMDMALIIGKALAFFIAAGLVGVFVSARLFRLASFLRVRGMLLVTALVICFVFSWAAELIGLAAIVGAFAAGITLEDVHYKEFTNRGEAALEEILNPIAQFLVPIFFVNMGLHVDLSYFGDTSIILFAAVLTAAAIIGKQSCALGVLEKDCDRATVGLGMIPRGEVGLIVAGIGEGLYLIVDGTREQVVSQGVFAAVVIMVMVTTMMTPPLLKWRMTQVDRRRARTA
ncbi:MAG: hypothetical protein Kow0059_02030 [Candidatus Sumerlaeia bacterium]